MEEKDGNGRVFVLEQEVKSLTEELSQCQADKEFVWSLWKRLQVANPDLTQAVSLIAERERQKAEAKDRKVLEILQAKDYKIQELEQKVTGQQQEINNLYQSRQRGNGELDAMKEELAALRQRQGNTSRELKEWRERGAAAEEEGGRVASTLEEERRGLEERCAALLADLERAREQQAQASHHDQHIRAKVKELEQELGSVKQQVCDAEGRVSGLSGQLSTREQELAQRDDCVAQLRRELQELQALYSQSVQHAGEQAQLIQQLEGLNLDTQRVLRSQEQAHTADTVSYHKLYTELSVTHRALVCNESQLRQREAGLSTQLRERDQQLRERDQQLRERDQQLREGDQQLRERDQQLQQLQEQLQKLQLQLQPPPPPPSTTVCTQTRQTNSQHFEQLQQEQRLDTAGGEEDLHGVLQIQGPTPSSQPQPGEPPGGPSRSQCPGPKSRQSRETKDAPGRRARSLSPRSSSRGASEGEAKIQRLQELLALKTEENVVLKQAHEKRQERLRLIQTNYRALREQLKAAEDAKGQGRARSVRAEPWQLRQENSDGVWNELAFFKRQNKKLLADKANLEEELDVIRVQAAMDRTTTQELRLCLEQEYQELLHRMAVQESEVSGSKPSTKGLHEYILRIEELERKMESLEEEAQRLHEDNQELQEANAALAKARDDTQAALHRLRGQWAAQDEACRAKAAAERERLLGEAQALRAEAEACGREAEEAGREAARARRRALRLRQELGVVMAERDFLRSNAAAAAATTAARRRAKGPAVVPAGRIRVRSLWSRVPPHPHRTRPPPPPTTRGRPERRGDSPARDGWEDLSADSGSEEYSDSLDNPAPLRSLHRKTTPTVYRCAGGGSRGASLADLRAEELSQVEPRSPPRGHEGCARKRRRMRQKGVVMRQRVLSLQQQIRALRQGREEAELQARQHSDTCQQLHGQIHSLTQKLASSKQLTTKLSTELTGVEQQKKVLEMELEQWRRVQVKLPPPAPPPALPPASAEPGSPALKQLEAEVKQLQTKLKNASNEVTKQAAACKSLRAELGEKDQRLHQLQEKLGHTERDVVMKKQLVEDMRTRLKFFQETDKSLKTQLEELERKVRSSAEEASNRKAFVESLKRRLSVATTEKSQCEATSLKLQEELQKKEQKLQSLQARVGEKEKALAELEEAASRQMHGLAQQSTAALEGAQKKLSLAHAQLQQLHTFIQALAREVQREAQTAKLEVRKRRRRRRKKASSEREGRLSKSSVVRAQSIAASILNMSESDLADMLDTDEETEDGGEEQDWLQCMLGLLQQQIPSAELLMDAMLAKMKERKVLTEELATLEAAVSEKA